VISLLLVIPVVAVSIAIFVDFTIRIRMPLVVRSGLMTLVAVSFILALLSLYQIGQSNGRLKGGIIALLAIGLCVLSIVFSTAGGGCILHRDLVCRLNLHKLKLALESYANFNEGNYPTPSKWCDLIRNYMVERALVCPAKRHTQERCSYALNPNTHPNSPPNMVLLFETKGGWNQFGGPELLSTENHSN
jgi:hypothetical protein